jgi:hypothetical protein
MSTLCKWLQLLFSVSAEPKAPNEEALINQIPPNKQLLTKKPLLTKKLLTKKQAERNRNETKQKR